MNPFTPSTIGDSTMPPVAEPFPTVIEGIANAAPVDVKPYTFPSPHPTNTLRVTKSRIGPVSVDLAVPAQDVAPTVTAPATPHDVSKLGAAVVQVKVKKTVLSP